MEALPLRSILLAASLIAGPPSKSTYSNAFHRGVGQTEAYLGRNGTGLRETQPRDTTKTDVTGFRTGDRMCEVLAKDRQGSVSLLNYCNLISCTGEELSNAAWEFWPSFAP